jgi:hypothetical protein
VNTSAPVHLPRRRILINHESQEKSQNRNLLDLV